MLVNHRAHEIKREYSMLGDTHIIIGSERFAAEVRDPRSLRSRRASVGIGEGPQKIIAPMPGKVVRLMVAEKDEVEAGQGILVVEAMKMQNEIKSPEEGPGSEDYGRRGQPRESRRHDGHRRIDYSTAEKLILLKIRALLLRSRTLEDRISEVILDLGIVAQRLVVSRTQQLFAALPQLGLDGLLHRRIAHLPLSRRLSADQTDDAETSQFARIASGQRRAVLPCLELGNRLGGLAIRLEEDSGTKPRSPPFAEVSGCSL